MYILAKLLIIVNFIAVDRTVKNTIILSIYQNLAPISDDILGISDSARRRSILENPH
jgi:hypothetical protein